MDVVAAGAGEEVPRLRCSAGGQGRLGTASGPSGHLDHLAQTFLLLQALALSQAQGSRDSRRGVRKQVCLSPGPSSVSVAGPTLAANQVVG